MEADNLTRSALTRTPLLERRKHRSATTVLVLVEVEVVEEDMEVVAVLLQTLAEFQRHRLSVDS
jgi:hypothetical protein